MREGSSYSVAKFHQGCTTAYHDQLIKVTIPVSEETPTHTVLLLQTRILVLKRTDEK